VNEYFSAPSGLPPAVGYSHAIAGRGRLVVVSGQLPLDEKGELVSPEDGLAQARQVFTNLATALEAAGAGPADVVKLGFYLLSFADLASVRKARDEFVGVAKPPASTLVQVAGLVVSGARLEVDALAITTD
jgi:enamine deaminase RidA (YjgF/YER057c/UK114 family)